MNNRMVWQISTGKNEFRSKNMIPSIRNETGKKKLFMRPPIPSKELELVQYMAPITVPPPT